MCYKKIFFFLFVYLWINITGVYAQDQKIADSLALIYRENELTDTAKYELLKNMSFNEMRDLKKGLGYAEQLISLSQQSGNKPYLRMGYFLKGTKERQLGNLDDALASYFKSAEIARESNHQTAEGEIYLAIADVYSAAENNLHAINYYHKAISILRRLNNPNSLAMVLLNTGDEFRKTKNYDSAFWYLDAAKLIFDTLNNLVGKAYYLGNTGMVYASMGKNDLAEKSMNEAIRILEETQDYYPICDYLLAMSDVYLNRGDNEAVLNYALRSLSLAEQHGLIKQIADANLKLSEFYEKTGNISESFKYYKEHIVYRDSLNNLNTVQQMAFYEVSQTQAEVDLLNQQKQNQKYLVISMGIILLLTIMILYIVLRNNQHKQKAYQILNLQKQETENQKAKAENALVELQLTQKQLIQTAKMASLGELTAGIAHEIQNPLNFVNNFSELSVELLAELREGTVNRLTASEKAEADEIINVLADNFKKISEHGKRADSIVKGMLQHSTVSTGKKEPTDINVLADEYLRLSYHGIRAKDKEFSANFTSNFDSGIGKMDVVPQDLGRVLLNLYNNAFYAVKKKMKQKDGAFKPLVSVTTKKVGNKIELSVKDNGIGIPQNALDKIFQPFFTTKPTGQGTGLGLSLSYDIIKAHGGEIKVETEEGEFAEFIIQLPIANHTGT